MSIQPQDRPGGQPISGLSAQQFPSPSVSPTTSSHRHSEECPACHAPVQSNQAVCVTCGTLLHSQPKLIRCRHCGKQGSSAYALCPHCGRALVAAPPLWLSWGLPGVLVLLFVLVLVSRMESGPLAWLGQGAGDGGVAVENPVLTPVRGEAETGASREIGLANVGSPTPPVDASAADSEANLVLAVGSATETPTPTSTPLPTEIPTPTSTPLPTQTAESSATPTATTLPTTLPTSQPTGTPTPSMTPTASPTATAVSRVYSVQQGDTAFSIANRFQVTVAELLQVNRLSPAQALQLKPGTRLEIPGTEPLEIPVTVTVTSTLQTTNTVSLIGTATALVQATLPGQQLYTVVSGDTLVAIALRFNISTEALLAANGLTIVDARDLQLGKKLIIPASDQLLSPTATATPGQRSYTIQAGDTIVAIAALNGISAAQLLAANGMTAAQALTIRPGDLLLIPPPDYVPPTATPRPTARPTAVPTPTPAPTAAIRLDAPSQVDPAQGINVSCSGEQFVRWNAVNGLAPDDEYVLFLGYVNSVPDGAGNVQVVPLLQQRTGQRTNWQMDGAYCGLAPQTFGRRWRWHVQVYADDLPVSPPSATWEFTWR